MSQKLLRDARFHRTLRRIDDDLAAKTRARGCHCGGRLHSARYRRKPRGGRAQDEVKGEVWRASFCCARHGCRQRSTPPSVRFLGRRVYLGVVVVLASALHGGVNGRRLARLQSFLGVSRRTVERWRRWWVEAFPATPLWRAARARFSPRIDEGKLPASLLGRFDGGEADRLVATLRLVSSLGASSRLRARIVMAR